MNQSSPLVSVIIPLYNCEKYIQESILSIVNQTYKNIEILVLNDGSTDNSYAIAQEIKDPRIKFFSQSNQGLANTLNTLISFSNGELIARQDQDDLSDYQRIEKQVQFLMQNPRTSLVGTWAHIFVDEKDSGRKLIHPTKNKDLRLFLYFDNPFVHTSIMFKKASLLKIGGYCSEKHLQPEDYELWRRFALNFDVANLPEFLVTYREIRTSMSRVSADPFPYLTDLSADYLFKNTYGLIPLKIAKKFSLIYHNKQLKDSFLAKIVITSFVATVVLLRELNFSESYFKKILRMYRIIIYGQ